MTKGKSQTECSCGLSVNTEIIWRMGALAKVEGTWVRHQSQAWFHSIPLGFGGRSRGEQYLGLLFNKVKNSWL